jgi:hypothetical protein
MAEGAYGKLGVARFYALVFGIAYLAVALAELIVQKGLPNILYFTWQQNIIHWIVGVVVLGSFFGSERTAAIVARVVGILFLVITVWGYLGTSLWEILGLPSGVSTTVYSIVHLVTAVGALYAGFSSPALRKGGTETPATS